MAGTNRNTLQLKSSFRPVPNGSLVGNALVGGDLLRQSADDGADVVVVGEIRGQLADLLLEADISGLFALKNEVECDGGDPKCLGVAGGVIHGSAGVHVLLDGCHFAEKFRKFLNVKKLFLAIFLLNKINQANFFSHQNTHSAGTAAT